MADETNNPGEHGQPAPRPRRLWPAIRALLRTRFVAGLLTIVPIWVTYELVRWVFNFVFGAMTSLTYPLAIWIAEGLKDSPQDIVAESAERWADYITKPLAFGMTLFVLYCVGLASANVIGRRAILLIEQIFERLPFIKGIYKAVKQIAMLFGGSQTTHFQRVVLVEFPRPGMKCIGFLTAVMTDIDTGRKMATIFISTTPNPTTGYMQIVPLEEVSETQWTVDEAVKLLMSGGILSPETVAFDKIHPVRWTDEDEARVEERAREAIDRELSPEIVK